MSLKLYYAPQFRGRIGMLRYLLDHSNTDWQEIDVWKESGAFRTNKAEYIKKFNNNFLITPFLVDENNDNLLVTSTLPILIYLGEKYDYLGKNALDKYQILAANDKLNDLRENFVKTLFMPAKKAFAENGPAENFTKKMLPGALKPFADQLKDGKTKFLFYNDKLTTADFYLFYLMQIFFNWKPDLLEGNEDLRFLQDWYDAMLNDPKIKETYEKEEPKTLLCAGNIKPYIKTVFGLDVSDDQMDTLIAWGWDEETMKPVKF